IPHHVPFPVDDSDVCLILLSDLLKHPFDPTLASMHRVFHHGVSPPVKLVPPVAPQGPPRCLCDWGVHSLACSSTYPYLGPAVRNCGPGCTTKEEHSRDGASLS